MPAKQKTYDVRTITVLNRATDIGDANDNYDLAILKAHLDNGWKIEACMGHSTPKGPIIVYTVTKVRQ